MILPILCGDKARSGDFRASSCCKVAASCGNFLPGCGVWRGESGVVSGRGGVSRLWPLSEEPHRGLAGRSCGIPCSGCGTSGGECRAKSLPCGIPRPEEGSTDEHGHSQTLTDGKERIPVGARP